jgi:hypothetical protein
VSRHIHTSIEASDVPQSTVHDSQIIQLS